MACKDEWYPERCYQCEKDIDLRDEKCENCHAPITRQQQFTCQNCKETKFRYREWRENFDNVNQPIVAWLVLQPIVESMRELGRDQNGSPLLTEKIAFLDENGITEPQEREMWRFFWLEYNSEVQAVLAELREKPPEN